LRLLEEEPYLINPGVALDPLWQYLVNGDFTGYINAVYTSVVGVYYYGLLILFILMPMYLRSRSVVYVMIFWLVTGVGLINLLPAGFYQIGGAILYLTGGGLLYFLFRNMRD
jgi:hypothetical protein